MYGATSHAELHRLSSGAGCLVLKSVPRRHQFPPVSRGEAKLSFGNTQVNDRPAKSRPSPSGSSGAAELHAGGLWFDDGGPAPARKTAMATVEVANRQFGALRFWNFFSEEIAPQVAEGKSSSAR
jgi:hypothetical protein